MTEHLKYIEPETLNYRKSWKKSWHGYCTGRCSLEDFLKIMKLNNKSGFISFTGPMAHVYRKYVTTEFNYAKALDIILLFKKVNVIDTKRKK